MSASVFIKSASSKKILTNRIAPKAATTAIKMFKIFDRLSYKKILNN